MCVYVYIYIYIYIHTCTYIYRRVLKRVKCLLDVFSEKDYMINYISSYVVILHYVILYYVYIYIYTHTACMYTCYIMLVTWTRIYVYTCIYIYVYEGWHGGREGHRRVQGEDAQHVARIIKYINQHTLCEIRACTHIICTHNNT